MGEYRWWKHKFPVFVLTYMIFVVNRTVRKAYPYTKSRLTDQWLPRHNASNPLYPYSRWDDGRDTFSSEDQAQDFTGYLDAEFMGVYCFGTMFSGWAGDRFDTRYIISTGCILQAVAMICFGGISEWTGLYASWWYVIWFGVLAFGQSTSWPNLIDVMSCWYGRQNRGLVLGLWASTQSAGNVVGGLVAVAVVKMGYELAYIVPAGISISCAIIVWFGLVPHPDLIPGEPVPPTRKKTITSVSSTEQNTRGVNIFKAILLPGVLAYCICVACLKFVNQAFFAWLPYFLRDYYGWHTQKSDLYSTYYDVGAVVGTAVGGIISDHVGRRSPVVTTMLLSSVLVIGIFMGRMDSIGSDEWKVIVIMVFLGVFVGGCYTLCVSTVSADLGTQPALANDEKALATVTGLIDGIGSMGAAIGLLTVGPVQNAFDSWAAVFVLFMIMNLLSALCIVKITVTDVMQLWRRRKHRTDTINLGVDVTINVKHQVENNATHNPPPEYQENANGAITMKF